MNISKICTETVTLSKVPGAVHYQSSSSINTMFSSSRSRSSDEEPTAASKKAG